MNEGDIVTVFCQFGEIVDCRLVREKETGKSKGFAYLAYEDQRSTDLAVDNLNGSTVCERVLKVDHVHQYRIPKEYLILDDGENVEEKKLYIPTGPDGKGWGEFRVEDEEELRKIEDEELSVQERELKRNLDSNMFILDEDERVYSNFILVGKNIC
jgi:RNA-binding motif X-linked protein 2